MSPKRSMPTIEVDDRTVNLEEEFLACRAEGHKLGPMVPATSARRAELAKVGQVEVYRTCELCKATRTQLLELPWCTVLESHYEYPEGYLLAKGSGRLPRSAAVAAYFDRHARTFL